MVAYIAHGCSVQWKNAVCNAKLAASDVLGDAPEHEADAHPSLEEHREPREVAELGFVARLAELDLAVAGEGQVDDEDEEERRYEHVHPAETTGDPAHDRREHAAEGIQGEHAPQTERRGDGDRDPKHGPKPLTSIALGPGLLRLSLYIGIWPTLARTFRLSGPWISSICHS